MLNLIREQAKADYPAIQVVTYSPPFRDKFSEEENRAIIDTENAAAPDLQWIGMTTPKQEKCAYANLNRLRVKGHIDTIGVVFDFYAGTVKRTSVWWQKHSLEWLYRFLLEPRRMWRHDLIGNTSFLWNVFKEKYNL